MSDQPSNWRGDLDRDDLTEDRVPADPIVLFDVWFEAAKHCGLKEPAAMTLATVEPDQTASARIVLLKGFDTHGFRFYTNYQSNKAVALAANRHAALVFWWEPGERQVRITGAVEKLSAEASSDYFARRPRGSQVSALASPQSRIVSSRSELEARAHAIEAESGLDDLERPEFWGGYNLNPATIEFWQARENRLHDRLRYRRAADAWRLERLAP